LWNEKLDEWWKDEYREACERQLVKDTTVGWIASLPWTHLYHQTFRREITNGLSAIALGEKFLRQHARELRISHALLVAERHPHRAEKNRKSAMHVSSLTTCSRETSTSSRTRSTNTKTKRTKIEQNYEGRRGHLFHLHGLLSTTQPQLERSMAPSLRDSLKRAKRSGRSSAKRSNEAATFSLRLLPFWKDLKERAFRELGIARVWPIQLGAEVVGTVYAVKYILKSQNPQRVTPEHYEPTQIMDDWTILEF